MLRFLLGAVLSGAITSLAFDPLTWWPAGIIGVAGLFVLIHRSATASWRGTAALGLAFGLGFMAPLIWWMNAISTGAYVALTLTEATAFALVTVALRCAIGLAGWPMWFASIWVLGEFARSHLPFSGFPWGRLAHTVIDSPLEGYVRLVGMPTTSGIVAALAGALAWIVLNGRHRMGLAAGSAAAVLGVGMVLPTGLVGADGLKREAEVALVQGDVPGAFFTWKAGEIFKLHAKETEKLAAKVVTGRQPHPDVVLWPENSTDVDPDTDPPQAERIKQLSAVLQAPILVGGLFNGPTVDTAYNAGVVWTASGPGDRYIKRTVVPYGEYVPFRRVLGPMVPQFNRFIPRDMLPGTTSGVITAGNVVLGDAICWDIAFDEQLRENVVGGAQMLVVQTSNASFTGTHQPAQQFTIARLRAIESGRWVLVPSTNGISGIIDADGDVVAEAPLHRPAILAAAVPLAHGATPAVVVGRWLEWLISAAGAFGCALGWRRR